MAVRPIPPDARAHLSRRGRRRARAQARARARALAIVLTIASLVCLAFGVRADPAPADARSQGDAARSLRTPLGSPRRTPAIFVDAVAVNRLNQQLGAIVAPVDACVAVNGPSGPLSRINATRPLAGASTQKLLVAAAALSELGPTHRFATRVVSDAATGEGEVSGDLIVVGGGDPVLTTETDPSPPATRLSDLADAIVRAGIRSVDGALVADDSRYDRERAVPDWTPSEIAGGNVGALGALVVNGGYASGTSMPASDPGLDTVQQLAELLVARDVQISQGVRDAVTTAPPDAREIARVESAPLAAIVEQMLTMSDNGTAELLTRELGHARADTGTTAAGTKAVGAVLAPLGVPVAGVELHDGSGLAPSNRVTCDALLAVIELSARPGLGAIDRGLAIAGRTGTLALRFAGTPLAGRLRAKTGRIDGVVGLAGVMGGEGPSAGPRFAFVANGTFSTDEGELLQDEIAATIGAYPDAPAAAELVPAPPRPG